MISACTFSMSSSESCLNSTMNGKPDGNACSISQNVGMQEYFLSEDKPTGMRSCCPSMLSVASFGRSAYATSVMLRSSPSTHPRESAVVKDNRDAICSDPDVELHHVR